MPGRKIDEDGKVNVHHQAKDGETALTLASVHRRTDIVWELLKHNPCEALAWATDRGQSEIVRCLDPNGSQRGRREATMRE